METAILKLTQIPLSAYQRKWALFEFRGVDFRARYFVFGDQTKPTMVFCPGFLSSALNHFRQYDELAKHFRVIMMNYGSWGGNT